MPLDLREYNSSLPPRILVMQKKRLALMYSAKCGSSSIVYWWLGQLNLLEISSRFSLWSHEFEQVYRLSRENVINYLSFNPDDYATYKFVRNPFTRALSSFRFFLKSPEFFSYRPRNDGLSFNEFLDDLRASNYCNSDVHFTPQLTSVEAAGLIKPRILKTEDGINNHFRMLERVHSLDPIDLNSVASVRQAIRDHLRSATVPVRVGPDEVVKFRQAPAPEGLLTSETIQKIASLYEADLNAYGYSLPADS
jgi:hypothetical protein